MFGKEGVELAFPANAVLCHYPPLSGPCIVADVALSVHLWVELPCMSCSNALGLPLFSGPPADAPPCDELSGGGVLGSA